MDEINAHIESEINNLKALMRRTDTLFSTILGALKKENVQHGGNTTKQDHPKPILMKGRLIQCYLCSKNNFMMNYPL